MDPNTVSKAPMKLPACDGALSGILTVVALYATFAALWILLSDKAVQWWLTGPAHITLASTLKGWAFVAITSLLLYGLMRRLVGRAADTPLTVSSLRPLFLPLVLLSAVIVAMTAGAIAHSVIHQKDKEAARLQAISDLRTRQIADWLDERYRDARYMQTNSLWTDLYHRWQDKNDLASRDLLQSRMNQFRQHSAFQEIHLLDEQGRLLWNSQGGSLAMDPALAAIIRKQAGDDGQVSHLGPYRDAAGRLHLDFLVSLTGPGGGPGPVVILHVDPQNSLFPMLKTWPVPSISGETLLFRREGEQALYLNELRHQADTAGLLRLPMAREKLLAVRLLAGEGTKGRLMEGIDYRGAAVMGVGCALPGTDWFMVTKIDKTEIYGEATSDVLWISLVGLLALFMAITAAFLLRKRQELAASLREKEIQAEKLRALQLLDAIAEGSADAIFAKDQVGRYLLFNREAARVTGKSSDAVLGQDDKAIFPPQQAALIMAHDRKVMQDNQVVSFQEDLTTVDGEVTFLAVKGPLHDPAGNVIGMFGISRDITERKRAEQALRDSLNEKVALLQEVHHRVKNNLQIVASLLSLQASRTTNRQIFDVLEDTRNRVRSMALLHEVLYRSENLARINFAVYVEELCTQLLRSFGSAAARIKVEKHVAPVGLALSQAVPCGLIISELVSNCLKHGFVGDRSGKVVVELAPDEGQRLVLCVCDNGTGLPLGFDPGRTSTLGLQLVSNLAGQLGGQLALERPSEGGTVFKVVFPVP
jgi:PAS domain S-box-containing protein